MNNQTILDEAYELVNGQRRQDYGHPSENITRISDLWSGYLSRDISSRDVVNMMILLKISRVTSAYNRDSYVDIAGYAELAEIIYDGLPEELA